MRSLKDIVCRADVLIIFVLIVATLCTRYYFRSEGYDVYDITMFKYGVDTLKPIHPPGYPVFLLFAKFLNTATHNGLTSLIYVSVISSTILVVTTYLISRLLFENRLIALFSALLILSNPTVWLFGVIGMSDMFQAAISCVVILFCVAALKYHSYSCYFISLFLFGITLGVKFTHILLIPLLIYTGVLIGPETKKLVVGSILSLTASIALWAIPFYCFMATPQLIEGTRGLLIRDILAFNVITSGPISKLFELVSYSSFTHVLTTINISITWLLIGFVSLFILLIVVKLAMKNDKVLVFSLRYSLADLVGFVSHHNSFMIMMLWIFPYSLFNFIFIASRLRYYLPIYPAIAIIFTFMVYKCLLCFECSSLHFKRLLPPIILSMIIIFSTAVSVITVSPYHSELDTRSQVIYNLTNLAENNSKFGSDTVVYINSIWPGRMDMNYYFTIYKIGKLNNMSVFIYNPLRNPVSNEEIVAAEKDLLRKMAKSAENVSTKVYLVGDLISLENSIADETNIFRFRLIGDFFRENEWVIDDPQGHICVYQYDLLGNSLWDSLISSLSLCSDKYSYTSIHKLEDKNLYRYLFTHAPENGTKYFNFSFDVPANKSRSVNLDLLYGFVEGASGTTGVNFSVYINGRRIDSANKDYTGHLDLFRINLTDLKGKRADIALGVDSLGNNAWDWSAWVPIITYDSGGLC